MNLNDQHQAELLDQYTTALRRDPNAAPPLDLTPEYALVAQQLHRQALHEQPDPFFANQLRQRLHQEATALPHEPAAPTRRPILQFSTPVHRWWTLGSTAALVVIMALVAAQFLTLRPQQVSAAEILQKAQAVGKNTTIRSFTLTETLQSSGNPAQGNNGFRNVTKRWYEAPNRWRIESSYTTTTAGTGQESHTLTQVSDGTRRWDFDSQQNTVTIDRVDAAQNGQNGLMAFGVTGLEAVLQEASACRTPKLQTDATVAGRKAYVIDLGESTCGSNSAPELNGRQVLWIDQETFFVLKGELYAPNSGQLIATREISDMQYNTSIDAQQFTFTPPANATIQDLSK